MRRKVCQEILPFGKNNKQTLSQKIEKKRKKDLFGVFHGGKFRVLKCSMPPLKFFQVLDLQVPLFRPALPGSSEAA
jgi:hypothetical protein